MNCKALAALLAHNSQFIIHNSKLSNWEWGECMPTPKVGNRYELRRRLEQRDGILNFEGWDTQQQRDVLVLLMRASGSGTAEEQTRLLQFARLAGLAGAEPDHALPSILDSGSDPPEQNGETSYYLVADRLNGVPLESKLPLDPEQAVAAVRDIGAGLRWARQRWGGATPTYDLDPARIVLDEEGRARLTSFGLPGMGGEEGEQSDVLALGNLLRTLLAGGASNEARSLSAAQALALAQVIGRSTASTSSRYADIPAFLDALQAALEGRQTPDPRFPTRRTDSAPANAIRPTSDDADAAAPSPATSSTPLTVSPVPDELADQPAEEAAIPSTVPSAPPSMGPLPQSNRHLVDAAEFTPPAPAAPPPNLSVDPDAPTSQVTVIRGDVPAVVAEGEALPPAEESTADAPNHHDVPFAPRQRTGSTTTTFFPDSPSPDNPDTSAVSRAASKRPPVLRPAPRLIDPQTGQLRGDLYVASSRRSSAQRVIGSLSQGNRLRVGLAAAVIVAFLLLLLLVILGNQNRNKQPLVAISEPTSTVVAVVNTSATATAPVVALATNTVAVEVSSPTALPPSPTAASASPTAASASPTPAFPTATVLVAEQATPCAANLADVPPSDPDYAPISAMMCHQAFYPAPGGNFARNAPVTRGEIAHAVIATMGWLQDTSNNPFTDVQPSTPFYADILTAVARGVMSGVSSNKFNPSGNLTRIQAISAMVRAAGWPRPDSSTPYHYSDVQNNNPLFTYVEAAYAHGVIGPTPNRLLHPNDPATRKDVALMLYNMLNSK